MKQPTIAIIGAGAVGSTAAYALILKNIPAKIILIDINEKKCSGEIQDLIDARCITGSCALNSGAMHDAGNADIIIITAGIAQKPGQTRVELAKTNIEIVDSIIKTIKPIRKNSIIIIVTNPVDSITRHVQEVAGIERNRIFGSGTFLDTQRLRSFLAQRLKVAPQSVQADVLGEHGDSQLVNWSSAHIDGVPLSSFAQFNHHEFDEIALKTERKAYDIIACKGFTNFGIATCIATYCEIILADLKQVIPVSCYVERYDVCFSLPAVLGLQGVEEIIFPQLSDEEEKKLEESARILNQYYAEIKNH